MSTARDSQRTRERQTETERDRETDRPTDRQTDSVRGKRQTYTEREIEITVHALLTLQNEMAKKHA